MWSIFRCSLIISRTRRSGSSSSSFIVSSMSRKIKLLRLFLASASILLYSSSFSRLAFVVTCLSIVVTLFSTETTRALTLPTLDMSSKSVTNLSSADIALNSVVVTLWSKFDRPALSAKLSPVLLLKVPPVDLRRRLLRPSMRPASSSDNSLERMSNLPLCPPIRPKQNQNQNSLLVKRQNDNTSPGDWPRKISL